MAHRFMQGLQKGERIKQNGQLAVAYYQNKKYPKLRVITGFEYDQFTEESKRHFYERV